jgi:hypothetical protein
VTVCVAAICDGNTTVVGASDRMLTAGDIQFEPQQTKVVALTNSIVIMFAGDAAMQAEVYYKVEQDVVGRILADPKDWWAVRDVADLYGKYYREASVKRAEDTVLSPLGLDRITFVSKQGQMNTGLVEKLATELINFQAPAIEAIVAGTSVVTSKPANEGHFKTGQRDPIQDESVVPRRGQRRQVFSISFGAPLGWLVYTGQT